LSAYGEIELSQPMVWKLSLNAALLEILSIRQNLTMEIGKDHRREETGDQFYLELSPRWKIPLTSKGVDVVEAAQVHPYWLVEGGALFTSPFALDQMSWELGTGLNLDIKLFGLYPIETDLKVIYHGGSEPGWSWGWYLYGGR
jgi:hypothetical protein